MFFKLATICLLLTGSSLWADEFYFNGPGNTTWNGVYVNPYSATDLSLSPGASLTIYCDDWNTEFSGNPTWNATLYTLTAGNLPLFKYGGATDTYNVSLNGIGGISDSLSVAGPTTNPDPLVRYLEAAWLDEQWQDSGAGSTTQIQLAAAEWTLFVDGTNVDGLVAAINSSGYADAVFSDLQAAQAAVQGGYTASGWDVMVVGDNSFPMQEFLVDAPVPEPSAIMLLSTIVALLGFTMFRQRRQS